MVRHWTACCLLLVTMHEASLSQGLNLDSLYVSRPSPQELASILDSFNITLVNGTEPLGQWALYDPYLFRPDSTAPSVYPLVNGLRVIREHRFALPIPFAGGDLYAYLLGHFRTGQIRLRLTAGTSSGGGGIINLAGVCAFWDGRSSGDPFTAIPPFSVYPFVHRTQLIIHEARHSDPDDPGHIGMKDQSLAQEGAYGRACIYQMWVWKHGLNVSLRNRVAAGAEAKDFLANRFVTQPATHPNAEVQAVIDELAATSVKTVRADAGPDTTITIPSSASRATVTLDGSRSYSVYAPLVQYRWRCPTHSFVFNMARPETTLSLAPGDYLWTLVVKSAWESYSGTDTLVMRIVRSATDVDAGPESTGRFHLYDNFPNPFNPTTVVSAQWPVASDVKLVVLDILGREVMVLANGRYGAGRHSFTFDARMTDLRTGRSGGPALASGVYYCRLIAGNYAQTIRMLLVR